MEVQKCINMIWCICFYLPPPTSHPSHSFLPHLSLRYLLCLRLPHFFLYLLFFLFLPQVFFWFFSSFTLPILVSDIHVQSVCARAHTHTQTSIHSMIHECKSQRHNLIHDIIPSQKCHTNTHPTP